MFIILSRFFFNVGKYFLLKIFYLSKKSSIKNYVETDEEPQNTEKPNESHDEKERNQRRKNKN